ncbi:MAG: hypothetical protein EZS28_019767 [Streblomastix strix]|uniref:RRM domain-containing protein n=1 Tax=Streblomastix strix TaxID=222440 RepID=A0A5J4VPY2_9EUKA|nr:MAG: hypothetical protein EZS28_019767 [Streblomastix strix]
MQSGHLSTDSNYESIRKTLVFYPLSLPETNPKQDISLRSNIYIYQIPFTYTESDLTNLFRQFGKIISTRIIRDKQTGRSKGYGFVQFDSSEAANAAIQRMDGYVVSALGKTQYGDPLQQVRALKVQLKKE